MRKRILITGEIVFLLCIGLYVSADFPFAVCTKGDVNDDGSINVIDAIGTVNIILSIFQPTEEQICAADGNGNGDVNVLDVLLIANVILYPEEYHFVSSCDELNCDDDNPCTEDYCDTSTVQCKHVDLSSETQCDDGNACTEDDRCANGLCQGTPLTCDDGNSCTGDSCNPDRGCIHEETCCSNGMDDDGDGPSDCNDGDCLVDADNDSYYTSPCGSDCDDQNASVHPGVTEICNDRKDNDCDGDTDCIDNDCTTDPTCSGCQTLIDIDGNTYQTIEIGSQCWMAENLKVTHYRNGDAIPEVTDGSAWAALSTGAYCSYDNNSSNVTTYGRLYNWYAAADSRNVAPEGWHVPTDDEWKELEMTLGMSPFEANEIGHRGTDEGGKLKETGTMNWNSPNTGATNTSGFQARPGGFRDGYSGSFSNMGNYAFYWATTEENAGDAWRRLLVYNDSGVYRDPNGKYYGFSIRCVRD